KCGKLLMFQSEAEMVRVEGGRPRNICHLVTHAVQAEDANWLCLVHHMLLRVFRRAQTFELEHADIELAKTSRVADDLEPRDLGVREGEGQYPGQLAACCEDQSNRSIDERRLYESQPSRHRDQLFRPCRSAPEFARCVGGVRCPPAMRAAPSMTTDRCLERNQFRRRAGYQVDSVARGDQPGTVAAPGVTG